MAVASPDRHRRVSAALRDLGATVVEVAVLSSESLGPAPTPVGRRASVERLARWVIRREVHAVLFGDVLALEVAFSTAERAGRLSGLLIAFTTDVVATVTGPASDAARLAWDIPARWHPSLSVETAAEILRTSTPRVEVTVRRGAVGVPLVVQGHGVLVGGAPITLTPALAALLRALARRPGETVGRAELAHLAWPYTPAGTALVEGRIGRLRERLGPHGWLVRTVHSAGYRLEMI